MNKLKLA